MAKIMVDTIGVSALRQSMASIDRQTDDCLAAISYVQNNIDMQTAAAEGIETRLRALQKRMQAQADKLAKYASYLAKVNDDFAAADRRISEDAKSVSYLADRVLIQSAADYQSKETLYTVSGQLDYEKMAELFAASAAITLGGPVLVGGLADILREQNIFAKQAGLQPAPVNNLYTKADVGKKVANINKKSYESYVVGNDGGYKYQCVSYARNRMVEKLGLNTNYTYRYGDAKDVAKKWMAEINKTKYKDENGKHYQIAPGKDGKNYKIQAYTDDKGSHIQADSFVCFGATKGNSAGHIVYVESVQMENGKKYVYYSEGGEGYHKAGTDGVLKRQLYDDFMTKHGKYTGCVTFTETSEKIKK